MDPDSDGVSSIEMERNPFEDDGHSTITIDPAQSFVLPTLDFSASFASATQASSQHNSPISSPLDDGFDLLSGRADSDSSSDIGSFSDASLEFGIWSEGGSFIEPPSVSLSRSSSNSWMSFSSAFSERIGSEGPREALF